MKPSFLHALMPEALPNEASRWLALVTTERSSDPSRFATWEGLVEHRRASLRAAGEFFSQNMLEASVALALTCDWQMLYERTAATGRLVLPENIAAHHRLSPGLLVAAVGADCGAGRVCDCAGVPSAGVHALLPAFKGAMLEAVSRTRDLYKDAAFDDAGLFRELSGSYRKGAPLRAGRAMLDAIDRRGGDVLTRRPELGWWVTRWCRLKTS